MGTEPSKRVRPQSGSPPTQDLRSKTYDLRLVVPLAFYCIIIYAPLFSTGAKRSIKVRTFTAYVEFDPHTKLYVAIVPEIRGAHTQAPTLDELKENLKEVLELCLEEGQWPDQEILNNAK
jgi:predicted RNase H-like HicB family nuclease